jgi:lipopolysaccharide transport system ATP-binding protein
MTKVISVENLSKSYRLGQIGTGTLSRDLEIWFAKLRGKPNPFLRINQQDHSNRAGEVLWALKDVSFEVEQGEVLGIIGRNGAGKSTLLKILSRVTAPTSGEIKVKGRIASLLEVGTGFHPELTGRENIYLNGAIMGMSKDEVRRKFDEIVAFAEVEKFIDTPVKRYSSGMYVRLAFAVAAHLDPEILLIDEVLAVGDAAFQKKCLGKIGNVAGEGRTVFFVSHNMGAIANICKRGMVLSRGTVSFDGEVTTAVNLYIKNASTNVNRKVYFPENINTPISIQQVAIFPKGKSEEDIIDVSDQLFVEIHYKVNQKIKSANISFALKRDGIVLFRSWDTDIEQEMFDFREIGCYTSVLELPKNLFAPGRYSIYVGVGQPGAGVLAQHDDCLAFEIDNTSTNSSRLSYSRGGLLNIPIQWKTVRSNVL